MIMHRIRLRSLKYLYWFVGEWPSHEFAFTIWNVEIKLGLNKEAFIYIFKNTFKWNDLSFIYRQK